MLPEPSNGALRAAPASLTKAPELLEVPNERLLMIQSLYHAIIYIHTLYKSIFAEALVPEVMQDFYHQRYV